MRTRKHGTSTSAWPLTGAFVALLFLLCCSLAVPAAFAGSDVDPYFAPKYNSLGGAPGAPTSSARACNGGYYQDFSNGRLYWNNGQNAAWWVHGEILIRYDMVGRESSMGLPTSDEGDVPGIPGARQGTFTGGIITWAPGIGARRLKATPILTRYQQNPAAYGLPVNDDYGLGLYVTICDFQRAIIATDGNPAAAVTGGILEKYKLLGGAYGKMGIPTSDEYDASGVPGARMNDFRNGKIYWGAGVGAYGLEGAIFIKFRDMGGPAVNGIPTSDAYPAWSGWAQNMQKAIITYDRDIGTHLVFGGIMDKYRMLGGPPGALHLALSEEYDVPGVPGARETDFQNGKIFWSEWTGAHTINGGIYARYSGYCDPGTGNCGPMSRLGLPVSDEYPIALPGGGARSRFEHGFITWWAQYGTWVDVT